jgi:hypothetical protein
MDYGIAARNRLSYSRVPKPTLLGEKFTTFLSEEAV